MVRLTNILVRILVDGNEVSTQSIPSMEPGEQRILYFDLPPELAQSGGATVIVSYTDEQGNTYPIIQYAVTWSSPYTAVRVVASKEIHPPQLYVGEIAVVYLAVHNMSNTPIRDIVLEDSLPRNTELVDGSLVNTINALTPFSNYEVRYRLRPLVADNLPVPPLKLSFKPDGSDKTFTFYFEPSPRVLEVLE